MARLNVNPTRMQLKLLKERLKTATRGHKLLKDKLDEMIRKYTVMIKSAYTLRVKVEKQLKEIINQFKLARALMPISEIEKILLIPSTSIDIETSSKELMNIEVPVLNYKSKGKVSFPYCFLEVSSQLDFSVRQISQLSEKLIKLAELEKTSMILGDQIEKSKRRVNALEYIMIPQLEETIKYITMKIEENDRSLTIRLLKVKSIIEEKK